MDGTQLRTGREAPGVRRGHRVRWLAALMLLVLCCAPGSPGTWASAGTAADDPLAIGQRIYRDGILPEGLMLQGRGQAGVTLKGRDAACTTCHRRSGYGSSEGPIEVRAITGPALFGERVAPSTPGSQNPAGAPTGQVCQAPRAQLHRRLKQRAPPRRRCVPRARPSSRAFDNGRSTTRLHWRAPCVTVSMSLVAP